jgi:hypothetical protein
MHEMSVSLAASLATRAHVHVIIIVETATMR